MNIRAPMTRHNNRHGGQTNKHDRAQKGCATIYGKVMPEQPGLADPAGHHLTTVERHSV
ncbi:MAG: hypothetical protein LJE74_01035 [Proteobacteria bacterium]|nr:hypothetical protein [Pseudomonadota bacterium]MCG6936435.1 hypothetical protein [Pseudomonadota bacterium]